MKKIILLISLGLLLSCIMSFLVQAEESNPFIAAKPLTKPVTVIHYSIPFQKFLGRINGLQHNYTEQLSMLTKEVKVRKTSKIFLSLILIAFIYGTIHALGPGHGKTLTFSYFLSTETAKFKKGLLLGNLIAFFHVSSAIIIVLILYFVIKKSFLNTFEDVHSFISRVSAILVLGVGLFLLAGKIIRLLKPKKVTVIFQNSSLQSHHEMLSMAFSIGMIPCPGALVILLFSLSLNLLSIGILLVYWGWL